MVRDITTASRSRRSSAYAGKKVDAPVVPVTNRKSNAATKVAPSAKVNKATDMEGAKATRASRARKVVEPDSASELSDLEDEEDLSVNTNEEEQSALSSITSESERDHDDTSDYEETGKKKKGKREAKGKQGKANPGSKKAKLTNGGVKKATARRSAKPKSNKAGNKTRTKQANSKEALPINEDNKLFNRLLDSEASLQTTAEEWIGDYQDNPHHALAQLVNFVLRCTGCNTTIDEVQAVDLDSIPDHLDVIQLELKENVMPSYPLASRSPKFRKFRRSLQEWSEKLFMCADEAEVLYDEEFRETFMAWISAMSSSAFRSIRHTATLLALFAMEQVNTFSRESRAEVSAAVKSRDAEKRKGTAASKSRLKDLNDNVKKSLEKKKLLDALRQELFDSVYIHRYRDSDPLIRTDCILELGRWMKSHPDQYLQTTYFRCLNAVLSDPSEKVRLTVIKCLSTLYGRHEFSGSLQQFTERVLPRMIEMAVGDVDVAVRVASIVTLTQIDNQDIIDDKARESIALHIFDVDARIRNAVSDFVKGILDEKQQETFGEESSSDSRTSEGKKVRWKNLAQLLCRLGKQAGNANPGADVETDMDDNVLPEANSSSSRNTLAVSALLNADEELQHWSSLLEILSYDHSSKQDASKGRKGRGNTRTSLALPNEDYRLEPEEESILLEAVSISLERVESGAFVVANTEEDSDQGGHMNMTRDLIPFLPKLFTKYKTEVDRNVFLLSIIKHLKLQAYLEFQQVGAYEALWDEVIDQFLRHTETPILQAAAEVVAVLSSWEAMTVVNTGKLTYLRETVLEGLQDCIGNVTSLSIDKEKLPEKKMHQLIAYTSRLRHLIRRVDLSKDFEMQQELGEEEQLTTLWSLVLACARRGVIGNEGEADMVNSSLSILTVCLLWLTRAASTLPDEDEKRIRITMICNQRAGLLEVMESILTDKDEKVSRAVKRHTFTQMLDLYMMYASISASFITNDGQVEGEGGAYQPVQLRLRCNTYMQEKLANFVKRELAQYAQDLQAAPVNSIDSQETIADPSEPSWLYLRRQMKLISTLSHYIGAIRLGIIRINYAAPLLAHFARLGHVYDACLKSLVDTLREVGIQEDNAEQACTVIEASILQAHEMLLSQVEEGSEEISKESEMTLVNLAKMLSSSFVVRGAQLAILQNVSGQAVIGLHRRIIELICSRLADREDQQSAAEENSTNYMTLFKVLSQWLISLQPKEAIVLKAALDRSLHNAGIEVPMNNDKSWDPLRQYEKRLVTIASKSDSVRKHVEGIKARKGGAGQVSIAEEVDDDIGSQEGDDQQKSALGEEEQNSLAAGDQSREELQLDITMDEQEVEDDE